MKILITGGTGFLGSHLAEKFLVNGHEVYCLDIAGDSKIRHLITWRDFHSINGSVMNKPLLEDLVSKCDIIYHMAAIVGVEHYIADPYHVLNVNIKGTQNVLEAAYMFNKKVIFTSTSEIYGKSKDIPFKENGDRLLGATNMHRWCYSTSKAAGEHLCFAFQKKGLPVVILRYFNVYGPRLDLIDKGRVITIFMGQLLRNDNITIIGNGKQTRCFTYITDAMEATFKAGLDDNAIDEIFNIGDNREVTINELAKMMIQISGSKSNIKYVTIDNVYDKTYEDIPRRVPDISKMNDILGVKINTTLEDGLKQTIDWFRRNT